MEWLIVYRIGDGYYAKKVWEDSIENVLYNLPDNIDKNDIISIARTY